MRWARIAVIAFGAAVGVAGCAAHIASSVLIAPAPASSILQGVSAADAQSIREFYAAMADIVVRDGASQVVKTTFDLRQRHRDALAMAFIQTQMVGKYAGLGDRLDQYLLSAAGDTDVPLTPEVRQSVAKALLAIK